MREIEKRCFEKSLTPPSRKAVTGRILLRDQRVVLRRRHGAAFARAKLGRVVGHLSVDEPLGVVQIDHTLADVMVVSEVNRVPLGRPWLTLAVDVATRMVAGFYLSLEPPSALSVALVLTNAIWSKDEYLQSRAVDVSWPVAGLPARLHLDNAKEFRSQALARGAAQYGIELQYRPPATPHWGGHIERLIGTTMGALRLLPGATGASVADRPEHPEDAAVMTVDELEIWLIHQIAGIYHNSCHRSLGCTPMVAWTEAVGKLAAPHRLPEDRDVFFRDFLPFRLRTVQRQGLSLFGITYSDGILSTMLAKPREKFVVRYDPRDMSRVYLRDPDGIYWPIPYSDRRLPPVTLTEIRAASRRVRAAGERHARQRQLFTSMEEQRLVVEEAATRTRVARRDVERNERALRLAARVERSKAQPEAVPLTETNGEVIRPFEVEEWS